MNWKTEIRKLSDLKPAAYNPRKFSKEQKEQLRKSIDKFSLADPLIINKNNTVIGGHFRLKILKERGDKRCEVRVPDSLLSEAEERELNLRLNLNLGAFDFDLLMSFDPAMLKDVGFDPADIQVIFPQEIIEDEAPPLPKNPKSKRGQVCELGRHRLMCGDATSAEDVAKLVAGKKADMVFTDPPYGVSYQEKSLRNGHSGSSAKISGDESVEKASKVYGEAFKRIAGNIKDGASYYVFSPQGGDMEMMMMMMMMKSTIPCRHQLIWKKDSPVFSMGRLDYDYQHEPILYGWKGSHKHLGAGKYKTSVWEIPRPKASKLHPTMKPIELIANAIFNSSKRADIILDLFGGSGSTLIAAEQTGRTCFMMEIDPAYCDVIQERYEIFKRENSRNLQAA